MNKNERFLVILNNVAKYFNIIDATEEDFVANLADRDFGLAYENFKEITIEVRNFKIIKFYLRILFEMEDQEYDSQLWDYNIVILDFQASSLEHINMDFAYLGDDMSYIHGSCVINDEDQNLMPSEFVSEKKIVLIIIVVLLSDPNIINTKVNEYLNFLSSKPDDKAVLLSLSLSPNIANFVSCLYGRFIASGRKLKSNSLLVYPGNSNDNIQAFSSINPNSLIDYSQYFELLDVFNAVNSTNSLVDRFLKVFNLLEYLIYRKYLVALANNTNGSRMFVRELLDINRSQNSGEKNIFIESFRELFYSSSSGFNYNLRDFSIEVCKPDFKDFVFKYYKIKVNSNFSVNDIIDISQFAKIIYQLRCSIVHSKETEFHITVTNIKSYEVLIPFLNLFISKTESLIFKMIAQQFPLITYSTQHVNLY